MKQVDALRHAKPCTLRLNVPTEAFVEIDAVLAKPRQLQQRLTKQHEHPRNRPGTGFHHAPLLCFAKLCDCDVRSNVRFFTEHALMQLVRGLDAVGEAADQFERRVGVGYVLDLSLLLAGQEQRVRIADTDPGIVGHQVTELVERTADITFPVGRAVENPHNAQRWLPTTAS